MKAIIYLMHGDSEQLDLWLHYLNSENIEFHSISSTKDMVSLLESTPSNAIPSMIMVEMGIQVPGTNLLQASKIGRWCKDKQLPIKLIFLALRLETELTKLQHNWAVKQGALCIIPKLTPDNLEAQVNQVYNYLNVAVPANLFKQPLTSTTTAELIETPSTSRISPPLGIDKARELIERKDFAGAMNQLKEVIKSNPKSWEAYLLCGEIYTNLKNLDKALQAYSEAVSIDMQNSESYFLRGLTYNNLKNYHAAIADFNQAIKLEPNFPEAYNARGLARKGLGDLEGAQMDFSLAINIDFNYAEAYLNRGMLLYSMGDQAKASIDYEKAVELDHRYEGSYFAWANNSQIKGLSIF